MNSLIIQHFSFAAITYNKKQFSSILPYILFKSLATQRFAHSFFNLFLPPTNINMLCSLVTISACRCPCDSTERIQVCGGRILRIWGKKHYQDLYKMITFRSSHPNKPYTHYEQITSEYFHEQITCSLETKISISTDHSSPTNSS